MATVFVSRELCGFLFTYPLTWGIAKKLQNFKNKYSTDEIKRNSATKTETTNIYINIGYQKKLPFHSQGPKRVHISQSMLSNFNTIQKHQRNSSN